MSLLCAFLCESVEELHLTTCIYSTEHKGILHPSISAVHGQTADSIYSLCNRKITTTHSIVSVYIANLPIVVRNTHPIIFFIEVHELPALFSFFFIQFWIEWETIQLLVFHWKTPSKQTNQTSKTPQISHPEIILLKQNFVLSFVEFLF